MRRVYVDASSLITLASIGQEHLLRDLGEQVWVPEAVINEVQRGVAAEAVEGALEDWMKSIAVESHVEMRNEFEAARQRAASHLDVDLDGDAGRGDLALLTLGVHFGLVLDDTVVIVTDDKPLRKTCRALGIPVSGSIGVLIAAVERGDLDPEGAKDALVAMDEVGARLSARLLRRAERLIDQAAGVDRD